jgi:hypothetical protein
MDENIDGKIAFIPVSIKRIEEVFAKQKTRISPDFPLSFYVNLWMSVAHGCQNGFGQN